MIFIQEKFDFSFVIFDLFCLFRLFPLLKRRLTPLLNSENVNVTKNVIVF